ncbi:pheromone A receptor-domain-containing protein [Mycena crocata]|nr:pheromone A receptor-domain-containing protein [Mycena crocata]
MHPELAVGASLACVLVLVPFPWHWRARNIATLSIIAWLFLSNFVYGVNAIIWSGSLDDPASVWCDMVTKMEIGATAGLPACSLSLAIQLWRVSCGTRTQRRRIIILDLILCWGYPVITMALHYIVQGHRYNIIEDLGCLPTTYVSIPAILVLYGPVALVLVLTFVYCGLAFATFYRRRRTFTAFLQSSHSPFTTRRYLRLMAITVVLALWDALVMGVVYAMAFSKGLTASEGLLPYTSWADVHSNFSRVPKIPTVFMPPGELAWTYLMWWTIPLSSYLFFALFSFGEEARAEYGPWARWVKKRVLRIPEKDGSEGATVVLPPWTIDDEVTDIKTVLAEPPLEYLRPARTRDDVSFYTPAPSYTSMV